MSGTNVNSNKVKRVREQTTRQYSDYKKDAVPSITGDKYELEGYSSDNDKTSFYRSIENGEESGDEGFLFVSWSNRMVIRLGQRFKDVCQFRRALEVIAIREGFKICIV